MAGFGDKRGVLHGALLAVLHRGVRRRDGAGTGSGVAAPPDHVLALAVYLLTVAADLAAPRPPAGPASPASPASPRLHARRRIASNLDAILPLDKAAAAAAAVAVRAGGACGGGRRAVRGVPLLRAFAGGALCDNARTVVAAVPPLHRARPHLYPRPHTHAHSDSDTEWEPSESETGRLPPPNKSVSLPATSTALAVPTSLQMARLVHENSVTDDQSDAGGDASEIRALESGSGESQALVLQTLTDSDMESDNQMTLAIPADGDLDTPPVPIEYDIAEAEGAESPWQALPAPQQQAAGSLDLELAGEPEHSASDTQMQVHSQPDESIPVNESIISLLLKLHSQLSGRLDSFSLEEPGPITQEPIGDGPHFIGILLRKLAALDARCAGAVQHVRRTLWPHQRERQAEQRARERREKEERSRRARERQQQLMREFARRQQQFLAAARATDCAMDWDDEPLARAYDCVICNTTAPATHHDPIGLVVLLQSTSVLGHRRRAGSGVARLALSEADRARLAAQRELTAAAHHYRLHDDLQQHFDQESWVTSVSVGWEGGVAAQSCGHHLHLRCLRAYLRALAAPRPHNLRVERGEFLCPVCRQLANSVLPRVPPPAPAAPSAPTPAASPAAELLDMLEREHPPPSPSRLSEAMGKAMEDMTAMAGGKLKQRYGSSPAAIFTFVASLLRTNLECELVQRGGALLARPAPRYKPRDDCIEEDVRNKVVCESVPLMSVAGAHARALAAAGASLGAAATWRALRPGAAGAAVGAGGGVGAGAVAAANAAGGARPVPLLLRDPLALLMHLLLLAPHTAPYLEIQHFTCIVSALYALTYYQVVCQLCAGGEVSLGAALLCDDAPRTAEHAPQLLDAQVQELILPFLRISALLRKHIYGQPLPEIENPQDEFPQLVEFLELASGENITAASALHEEAATAAKAWARQLASAASGGQLAIRRVIRSLHVVWAQPALLALPRDYDRLFTYYHERVCLQCGAVPKEASVCLLCGTLVCLKQACCRRHQVAEAVQHAQECGGGTGIFLVVTSTYIIVIRGRRACLWGSLYLDDYDEEDRDLKRGKPLYLSQDRLELLQAQWLAHRFDHTKRTWVWHRDSL
ncbi:unnamed protein product [Parnassius apollo]|uniref:E3 ubiquitin-protein ligase n=1 Tax=Parnassius apollo TaxID=110799 RepID=A0A8S3XS07_PARAO|nr:unnamed protein product [Parnassius apollo]